MPQNYQATPIAPSGGRAESLRRGLSDMDVARAAMGHGWPFVGGRLGRALGARMEQGNPSEAGAVCRG
ncbi:hypothetical protein F7R01_05255 [Pseudomonas argentinensis]|nr:hypothetical protein F7R01_05255 [Pseudomonas argentinensis]